MPKFTPLRERVLVAKATGNSEEVERIKREIVGSYAGTIPATAKKLGVNQLTLRRIAEELGIESDLHIKRSRGEPALLFSKARVAVETGDKKAVAVLRKQVMRALAESQGASGAARSLGVSPWVLRKTIDVLEIGGEVEREYPGKYSMLGERILLAQRTQNAKELDRIRAEIRAAFRKSRRDVDATSDALGVTTQTLRKISRELGLADELGFGEQKPESVVLGLRLHLAQSTGDRDAVAQIKKEVLDAFEKSDGMLKYAAKSLGVGEHALRQIVADLGMKVEIGEKFPGPGKQRMITARVNGRERTHSVAEWSRLKGTKRTTIIERLRRGYTPEQAIEPKDFREG